MSSLILIGMASLSYNAFESIGIEHNTIHITDAKSMLAKEIRLYVF